jgi:hypothetical protein
MSAARDGIGTRQHIRKASPIRIGCGRFAAIVVMEHENEPIPIVCTPVAMPCDVDFETTQIVHEYVHDLPAPPGPARN